MNVRGEWRLGVEGVVHVRRFLLDFVANFHTRQYITLLRRIRLPKYYQVILLKPTDDLGVSSGRSQALGAVPKYAEDA
jgi:hypothetical protein